MSNAKPSVATEGPLTDLQIRIVMLLAEGYTQGEIAEKIGYGRQWVCEQVGYLTRKMNAHNSLHAACLWSRSFTYGQASLVVEETIGKFAPPDAAAEQHATRIARHVAKTLHERAVGAHAEPRPTRTEREGS